jgi:hypothetical protein
VQSLDNNTQAFLALVRAGLWEQDVRLLPYQDIKWQEVYRLATEQSVLGLVLAGLEHSDVKPPKELMLQWIGEVQQIEQRNKAMDGFVAELIDRLRKDDVYCVLVKGQGVAQCYEKPMWRASGDIDLLLSNDNYQKAYEYITPLATKVDGEKEYTKHQALTISGWEVELHGTLRSGLWGRLEQTVDEVQKAVFYGGCVRSWQNGETQVFLPDVNEDVFFVFSHILQHFFKGGIGLRQIYDWCRLLWNYKEILNIELLEKRLRAAGVMSEWIVFGSMAVNMLGMPVEAMPFYSSDIKWKKKADRVLNYILETGNFGHNRDVSYQKNTPALLRKFITVWRQTIDNARHFLIFPKDSIKAWWSIFVAGMKDTVRGK